jgi:nitrogenase molybdenum-cofactor synthesis protein NifE
MSEILEERKRQIHRTGEEPFQMDCGKASVAGSVSQRACVFCGSRVVLYPIADALHLVHGPIGCAAYTWDIRGALSSGPELHRLSFSTDLGEKDVIYGGEKKLYRALIELIDKYQPRAAFVYATCIVGIIGDDVEAVCKQVSGEKGIPVLPVHSEGFKGTKKDGYHAACEALLRLVGTAPEEEVEPEPQTTVIPSERMQSTVIPSERSESRNLAVVETNAGVPATTSSTPSLNILGDFNLAGETWIVRKYYERMGVKVVATITGDARVADLCRAHRAKLNVVQCSGSMMHLAERMEEKYGIPSLRVSYFGIEDMAKALYDVAAHFGDAAMTDRAREIVREETAVIMPEIRRCRRALEGKRAAIYVGGAFKAFSLVRSLRTLGMRTVIAGSQTGNKQDYEKLRELCDEGTILIDDANPLELARFVQEKKADLLIGGVKERPIACKLGLAFCDHNHERKVPLAGFAGMANFAREVYASVMSPVWKLARSGGREKP